METKIQTADSPQFWETFYAKSTKKRIPLNISYELTYRCNLSCEHCYVVEEKAKRELEYDEITNIIDQLITMGCLSLSFTGGEIFTREDCIDLVEYAHKGGIFIELYTNGTLLDKEKVEALKNFRISKVHLSLYGITDSVYQTVTGSDKKGDCMNGILLLQEAGIPVKINTLVTKDNIQEVQAIGRFTNKAGYDFHSDPEITPSVDGNNRPIAKRVQNFQYLKSVQYLPAQNESASQKEKESCKPGRKDKSENSPKEKRIFQCDVGRNSAVVDPYGSLYLCQSVPSPKFDTKIMGVKKAWNNLVQYLNTLRPNKNYECSTCDLQDYCDWCPGCGMLEIGDMFQCAPYYKELAKLSREEDLA